VGFAAETDELETHARAKLKGKAVDMIAANWVGPAAPATAGTFGSDENALRLYWPGGEAKLPLASKTRLGRELIMHIAQQYEARGAVLMNSDDKVVSLADSGKRREP